MGRGSGRVFKCLKFPSKLSPGSQGHGVQADRSLFILWLGYAALPCTSSHFHPHSLRQTDLHPFSAARDGQRDKDLSGQFAFQRSGKDETVVSGWWSFLPSSSEFLPLERMGSLEVEGHRETSLQRPQGPGRGLPKGCLWNMRRNLLGS